MKTRSFFGAGIALSLVGLLWVGCGKQTPPAEQTATNAKPSAVSPQPQPAAVVSAEKTSFQEVTAHLDRGGNLYLYLGTEQWLKNLSGKISQWRGLIDSIPDLSAEQTATIGKVFNIVTNIIKSSGIEDVSGFGMSAIAREKGLYRSKVVLHHYAGKGSGLLWTLFGKKPHALAGLNLLSTNTAVATFADLDVPLLWSTIRKQAAESGFPEAEQGLNKVSAAFENATGLDLEKVLNSLGGEFGFVVTLDASKKVSVPLPTGTPLEIAAPGLALVARVKDDMIFNRVEEALAGMSQNVIRVDKPNLKMRTVDVPLPLPIQLRPTIASSEGYLFVATSDALIQEMLATKAGQSPGLKGNEEFQRLAKESPSEGNQFTFMSKRFSSGLLTVQKQALNMNSEMPAGIRELLSSFLSPDNANASYTVGANTEEGWISSSTGTQNPTTAILAAGIVAPLGMLSAIAIPNFVKARNTAQKNACANNLRMIDGAKQQWALENRKESTATPTRAELLSYFKKGTFPVCPAGGQYSMKPVGEHPECSIPGHQLND